jgi:hypothetical protein
MIVSSNHVTDPATSERQFLLAYHDTVIGDGEDTEVIINFSGGKKNGHWWIDITQIGADPVHVSGEGNLPPILSFAADYVATLASRLH